MTHTLEKPSDITFAILHFYAFACRGPFILRRNCVAVTIYRLLSAASHRSFTAFQVKMNFATPQCSYIAISVQDGAVRQRNAIAVYYRSDDVTIFFFFFFFFFFDFSVLDTMYRWSMMKNIHGPYWVGIGSWGPELWPHEYLISPIEISVNWPGSKQL